jgi:predicted dehydrogenase
VRVAVIGLGRSGLQHAALVSTIANVELVAIGDADRDARRNARGMGLAARAYATVDTLLHRGTPEALFVATSFDTLVATAIRALESGVAVQIEGSPALSASEAAQLIQAAGSHAVAASLPLVHHPVFACAQRIVNAGTLGAVREVRASRYAYRVSSTAHQRVHAERGATRGALAHIGAELVFVLTRMFGVPRSVTATTSAMYGPLDDELHGTWMHGDRARIGLEVSWSTPGYPRPATVIEIESEVGRMLVSEDALELDLHTARDEFPAGVTRLGHGDMPQLARFDLDGDAGWLGDAAFLTWVTGGPEPPTSLTAALDAARLIDALYASAAAGGAAVDLPS